MDIYKILGLVSVLFCFIGYIPYVYGMIKGKIQPHPVSWSLWAFLGFVTVTTYIGVGATDTLPLAIFNFLGPLIIFLFTIKYWKGGFDKFDYICLALSIISIIIYLVFHKAAFALSINLFADWLATLPTIRKTYKDPNSESLVTWILFLLAALASILAIKDYSYGILILPLDLLVLDLVICMLILRKKIFNIK